MTAHQMLSSPIILLPAYGRTYATREAMLKDWQAGKDFRLFPQGCYTSIRDVEDLKANASSVSLTCPHNRITVTL